MRILLSVIGLLVTLSASAQTPSPGTPTPAPTPTSPGGDSFESSEGEDEPIDCEALLESPTPVSPFTKEVLKRIKDGKDRSVSGEASKEVIVNLIYWAGASIKGAIDNQQRVIEQWRNLPLRTTCEQYDIILLECALEDVRVEIGKAVGSKNYASAYKLQTLFNFTNQRLRSFFIGTRDPRYIDTSWGAIQVFDEQEQVWCCLPDEDQCGQKPASECLGKGAAYKTASSCVELSGCEPPEEGKKEDALCPFSSDYFPAGNDGYGCDESVLKKLKNYKQAEREKKALEKIIENLEKFRKQAKEIFELEVKIAELLGVAPPSPPPGTDDEGAGEEGDESGNTEEEDENEKHKKVDGCIIGQCSNNTSKSCSAADDCGQGNTCDKGWKVCPEGSQGSGGACTIETPTSFLMWEKRGPFSAVRDEPKLMDVFASNREREPREISETLNIINEKIASQSSSLPDTAAEIREKVRQISEVKGLSARQGRQEADIYARGADPGLQIAEAMKPVREAGQPLMEMAEKQTGLRQLVIRYAWFLRRTCIDRACNTRLEQIIKLARADKCFPYTNGSYLTQSCDDPAWKACLEEAKLDKDFKAPELDCE